MRKRQKRIYEPAKPTCMFPMFFCFFFSPSSLECLQFFEVSGLSSPQICALWREGVAATSAPWHQEKGLSVLAPQGFTWTPATRHARSWTIAAVT